MSTGFSGLGSKESSLGSPSLQSPSRRPLASVLPPPPPIPFSLPTAELEGSGTGWNGANSKEWLYGGGPKAANIKPSEPKRERLSMLDLRVDSDTKSCNACMQGLPARTGTGVPVLGHHPLLTSVLSPPQQLEPLYNTNADLALEMMSHDAERMARPLEVRNRVVYDSLDAPPDRKLSAQAASGDPTAAAAIVGPPAPSDSMSSKYVDGTLPPPFYTRDSPLDDTLVFESRFESGNLRRAIQVYDYEYDLILRPDINTRGHTQWFYFSVSNTVHNVPYKFNIINMVKSDSLYQDGMQPLVFSEKEAVAHGKTWRRSGSNISYYQNNIKRKNGHYYYTFTCTYQFMHSRDTVYLAYCYPYTYTDLQRYLRHLEEDPKCRQRFRRRVLCQTLAGNNCDLLTITSFGGDPESLKHRKGVVITGRVHPGESNASWMMKGCLDFLTGPSLDAKILRDNFVFKIVPMLNPDGVINGNYRCSLAGVDLNRIWNEPNKKLHPTIYHTKMMIRRLVEDREVTMFCDFHGHSRKKNIFMYGCERKSDKRASQYVPEKGIGSPIDGPRYLERMFPKVLSMVAPHLFAYEDCNFKVQKSKESTARVVVFREFNLVNSFTLEASFAGPSMGDDEGFHYGSQRLQDMGVAFCQGLLEYCDPDPSRMRELLREIEVQCDPRQREYGVIHSTMATEAAAAPSTAAADEESEEEFDSDESDEDSDYVSRATGRRKAGSKSKKSTVKASKKSTKAAAPPPAASDRPPLKPASKPKLERSESARSSVRSAGGVAPVTTFEMGVPSGTSMRARERLSSAGKAAGRLSAARKWPLVKRVEGDGGGADLGSADDHPSSGGGTARLGGGGSSTGGGAGGGGRAGGADAAFTGLGGISISGSAASVNSRR